MAEDEDFRAGQIVGAQPDGAAIDCPFLPGDDGYRRRSWLGGGRFGSTEHCHTEK